MSKAKWLSVLTFIVALWGFLTAHKSAEPQQQPTTQSDEAAYPQPTRELKRDRLPYLNQQHVNCLAHMLYGEVRDEKSDDVWFAVAWVALNRARDNRAEFGGSDICDVVYMHSVSFKKHARVRWQFDGAKVVPKEPDEWKRALDMARRALSGEGEPQDEMREARYFYQPEISGKHGGGWQQRNTTPIQKVGNHIFGKEKEQPRVIAHR